MCAPVDRAQMRDTLASCLKAALAAPRGMHGTPSQPHLNTALQAPALNQMNYIQLVRREVTLDRVYSDNAEEYSWD